jgi:hypothetical protein
MSGAPNFQDWRLANVVCNGNGPVTSALDIRGVRPAFQLHVSHVARTLAPPLEASACPRYDRLCGQGRRGREIMESARPPNLIDLLTGRLASASVLAFRWSDGPLLCGIEHCFGKPRSSHAAWGR